ncbi:MAG TPA: ribosomal protein S18-alanine N-acetyltransferase [Accumulibacter sp.]|jgi:ribosomal-protein-alanine N-acetyltransferase|nr:ribosomal protein S18-alanine N-acetyltransferase [Accumulibacter sp.]
MTGILSALDVGDLDEVLAIENRVYPFPWTDGNFRDSLRNGDSVCGLRDGNRLIAYFVLMRVVDEMHLLNITVDPARQGQGYGAVLLRHALHLATQAGTGSVLLEVRPSNEQALAMYRHFGFQRIGVRRDYYPAHDSCEDAWVLRLPLPVAVAAGATS